jgi:hypothetical protein
MEQTVLQQCSESRDPGFSSNWHVRENFRQSLRQNRQFSKHQS